ncbi:MAG: hypothetical protein AAGC77_01105 [Pseudomonadota bacterium]
MMPIEVTSAVKIIGAVAAAALLPACATLVRAERTTTAEEIDGAFSVAEAMTAEMELEISLLKAENAKLSKKVDALEAENEELSASLESERALDVYAQGEERLVAPPFALAEPATTLDADPNTIVEGAKAPEIAAANAPLEDAPRLVQSTFAATDAVFENEAVGEIPTTSVLYGVHLASYRVTEDALAGWQKLQRENPDELGLLEPRVESVSIPERGEFLRLIGGGFSTEAKAGALCASLIDKGLYCAVSGFVGDRLAPSDAG